MAHSIANEGTSTPAEGSPSKAATPPALTDAKPIDTKPTESASDIPMDIVDVEGDNKTPVPSAQPAPQPAPPPLNNKASSSSSGMYPSEFAIDVSFEASKLPLDVAIFNSSRAAGGDDKIRKYLQAVLVIGGTALVPGIAHALESR